MRRRIVTAREQVEMLSPWHEAARNREFDKQMADQDWARRNLTPAQQRQQHEEMVENSPKPWVKTDWASRPQKGDEDYETGPEHLSQPTLPGMEKIRGESTRVWRGVPIDTTDPAFRRVWQMTYGQGQPVNDPGLFPDADLRYEDRGGKFDHPGLADAILDGFKSKGGVGEHHSTSFDVSDSYGWGHGAASPRSHREWRETDHLPVLLDSDWNGAEEDFSRAGSGNFDDEKEIMLKHRKAPLTVQDLRVPYDADESDDGSEWNSILDGPRNITAAMPSRTVPVGTQGGLHTRPSSI